MDFNSVKMENKKQKTSNFWTAIVKRCFSKDTKRGIKIALDEIKKQKRFDLEWEWMAENKTGEYIKVNDIINELQTLLKNCG